MNQKTFGNTQEKCPWFIANTKGYCAVGRKAGRFCVCFSPFAKKAKGLNCPYYWKGKGLKSISMKDIDSINK